MRKVLLTLLVVVLILTGLGAAGFAGYRYGYAQGLQIASGGDTQLQGFAYGPHGMPMHAFDRDFGPGRNFDRGFGMRPGGMMGFGFFGPLLFLAQVAFWGLVVWAIYTLIHRSGWRLTRTTQPADAQPTPSDLEAKG